MIRRAEPQDLREVLALLHDSALPTEGVAAPHGDDDVGRVRRVVIEQRRCVGGDVDADLGHRGDRGGVDPVGGLGAGRADLDRVAGEVAQPAGGHLRPAGVVDADEQDAGLLGHYEVSWLTRTKRRRRARLT